MEITRIKEKKSLHTFKDSTTSSEQLFDEDVWVSGYKNLAKYLHCSVPTVCRLVKTGKINPAIKKIGATYWFNKNMIRDLMKV
ncbi:MAG: DUF3853 family protein [Prevotella bivia]|nr:DUF3853 family protein [Prevotella bivia]